MKKSFFIFWLLLLSILSSAYADSNYMSYSNNSPLVQLNKTSNISTNIGDFKNLSAYTYDLASNMLSWTRQSGASNGTTWGNGISADSIGNSYVTGFSDVGLNGQKQNGNSDYFVANYNVNGNLIWTKQIGATGGYTAGQGISTDNTGNIYVTGYTTVGLSGQIQNGNNDYFIAKYDRYGHLIWTKQVGSLGGNTLGYGINADNSGNIYVTGTTDTSISGQPQSGRYDYFIAKYDSSGNLIWTKQVGGANGYTRGTGIRADSSGNAYVTGYTGMGISGQKQNGYYDYFIAKYDSSGNLIWTKQVGASGGLTYGNGISADNSGNAYITGYTNRGISGQKQNGNYDYYVAKYDQYGNLIWTKQVGTYLGSTFAFGISVDNSSNIYITGGTNVGISGQIQNNTYSYFIAKYDISGNLNGTTQVGASGGNTLGNGISTDNYGNVYAAGYTTVGLSGQKQNGDDDYYVVKYTN